MIRKEIRTFFIPVPLMILLIVFSPLSEVQGAIYYAKSDLLPAGDCTRADPCYFLKAVDWANDGDTVYFRQGTYKNDTSNRVLIVNKSVRLLGGWDGEPHSRILVRDPEIYPSILDGENFRRVIYIYGDISPIIDGFTIQNGDASGLATNCSGTGLTAGDCGGGIFVYQAAARIVNNKILSNKALVSTVSNIAGYGGGIHLKQAGGSVIQGNLIQGNQANPTGNGYGGGMSFSGSTPNTIQVDDNQFVNNSATFCGGIISVLQTDLIIRDNFFDNNNSLTAAGLGVFGAGRITKNHFQKHQGQNTVYLGTYQGIFEKNTVVGNNTNTGIRMDYSGNSPFPRLSNNIIAESGINAIMASGTQQNPLYATLEHNTLVGGGTGVAVTIPADKYATLFLTNNIIAGFPVGVENNTPSASTVTARFTLFTPDVANHGVGVNFSNSLVGDPAFKDPARNDYHIRLTSAARDAGTVNYIVTTEDMDGDPRIIGSAPDIGADEINPAFLYLPLIKK